MNLTQLRVFSEVMKSGSISRTAISLNRTQPAISLSIKNLEENLGFKLFERQGRQLIAVPEAFYLLEEANNILHRVSKVQRTMNKLQNSTAGSLKVASMPGPAVYLFPHFISQAIGNNNDVEISLFANSSLQIHELAATQSIDFGFADTDAGNNAKETPQYSSENINADCFCALPRNHPLAKKSKISVTDLDKLPMGGLQNNHVITQKILSLFNQENCSFNKIVHSQTYLSLLQFVSAGQCIVIVDPLTVVSENKTNTTSNIVFRPLKETLLYDYAVVSPSYRPLSQLAMKIKNEWISELFDLLDEIGANPQRLEPDDSSMS